MLEKVLVCLVAGAGAGFGTGLAGLSAAAVISPMLITFLHVNAYEAVGIALASDVLASAASAYTYKKNKNIDVKNGMIMLISVLIFTLVGSYAASFLPQTTMGGFSMFMTLFAGVKFIFRPVMEAKESNKNRSKKKAAIQSVACGIAVGLICGFVGAGGGMMMLLVLVSVLGYELKTAVGTSVFIMTFTALTGAMSHFAIGDGVTDYSILVLCIIFTLIGAMLTAKFANKASAKVMNRTLGFGLAAMSIIMIIINYV
ncbi:sulfite exporter TauE/SafE family protein [Dorea acetigenes]|uniref:Probable membrane transporter protein n=1 Tax=Dorea acetigenes TaxID=2981787 RepID=A0ABT2RMD9_9FIRM|nr:sulfite exporter TauE/SafE family protein [Dorea acetigenes]MCB6413522.1 sulfite exporter TauE/SafE family protein [Faecalimonas umbilicata]MCU6686575.1 sulfite exporter TauE/SafE family protein [Dorea acetigenes]SCJ01588.1 Sulfite exporter TauE/SafE [uncultured Clostridium sp.]